MSMFNSKSRRNKSSKKESSQSIDIARLEENFRAFVSMFVGGEKGKRAAQR